ncbi:MAG: ABC transporter permease [Xanthomonadales bacterium]|nr:ABC transporter permease [Xanthomonadales bacterium]
MNLLPLAARSLRREWRLPELRTLALALVLAVAALGVVATLSARVERGVLASAAQLLGGDIGVSSPAALPTSFSDHALALALKVSHNAGFPSVAFAHDHSQLLDVNAVEGHWPLRGTLQLTDAHGHTYDGHGPDVGAVYLDHRALVGLGLKVGDQVQVGGRELRIAAELLRQPDGGQLFALAPRAMMNLADARAAGLLGQGSRAEHHLWLAGAAAAISNWQQWAKPDLPQGAKLITPKQTQQRMRRAFDRAGAFLRLTSLLAALLAGVAIALAAQRYAQRKIDEVALMRAMGTPQRRVLLLLALTLALLALPAAAIGALLALGMAQLAWLAAGSLFVDMPTALPLLPALAAAAAGLAVLIGFALPPLARLAGVPPAAVFRRELARRLRRHDALYLLPLLVALGLIWTQSSSLKLAAILAASLAAVAVATLLLSLLLLWLARRLVPGVHPALRLGLAALIRRRGLSLAQATALSLGLTALLLLGIVAPALLDGWRHELPANTPNWFVLNLQTSQHDGFTAALQKLGAEQVNMLPLAVGKLGAINGHAIDSLHFDDPRAARWADRQLRLSWSAALPPANRVIAGRWRNDHAAQAQVSVDESWRDMFNLKIGDHMRFDVGQTSLDATVSSVRKVDWTSFRPNFFLLLDPAHAGALPHTWVASFHLAHGHADQLAALSRDYPNLSLIDIDALLDRIRHIVAQVSSAVRWVLGFSLLAGALVLAAALAASAQQRRHEAALLRTLGALRHQLRGAAACEFALLGLIAATTAVLGAAGAGLWLARAIFHINAFMPPWWTLAMVAIAAALIVMLLGLAGTRRVLRTSPLALLRRG